MGVRTMDFVTDKRFVVGLLVGLFVVTPVWKMVDARRKM